MCWCGEFFNKLCKNVSCVEMNPVLQIDYFCLWICFKVAI